MNHHYLFGILWQAMIWLLLYDDDIYDKGASQKFICTITNIYFSITKGIILLISETTWFQRVQKATIELKLTNWMAKHFSLHDFYWNFSISAFFISYSLFWLNTAKHGYIFNLTPVEFSSYDKQCLYYIFFGYCTVKTSPQI